MPNRWIIILSLILIVMVSACSQGEELPTAIAFPTDVPPAEVTEEVQSVQETATNTPVAVETLPPTWTFTPEVTDTLIPTETEIAETVTPLPSPEKISSVCDVFQADPELSTREFTIGDAPVAAWTPVEGAVLYRVFLYDFNSTTMRDDIYTDQLTWTFDPNVFELGQNYLWAVWPLDSIGDQMCFERGLEMIPQRVPINRGG